MKSFRQVVPILGAALLVAACAAPAPASHSPALPPATSGQPYAGFQERTVRALAPERVAELLAGQGGGYALAAELNHYPGPLHVLQLADELRLRPEQLAATSEIFHEMRREAQGLGRQLVDQEAELDRYFRSGRIDQADLARRTADIAALEGRLRKTHLAAHLRMKALLDPDQVARYDELRGYTSESGGPSHGQTPGTESQHQPGVHGR